MGECQVPIQAILLIYVFERKLSFRKLCFVKNDYKITLKCRWKSGSAANSVVYGVKKAPEKPLECNFKANLFLYVFKQSFMKIQFKNSIFVPSSRLENFLDISVNTYQYYIKIMFYFEFFVEIMECYI